MIVRDLGGRDTSSEWVLKMYVDREERGNIKIEYGNKREKNGNMKLIIFKARQQNMLKLEIEHISEWACGPCT